MRYFVNLYQTPEPLQGEGDNMEIGELCRSLHEAMEQAAYSELFKRPCYCAEFICVLNDPISTTFVRRYISEVEEALAGLEREKQDEPVSPEDAIKEWKKWNYGIPWPRDRETYTE